MHPARAGQTFPPKGLKPRGGGGGGAGDNQTRPSATTGGCPGRQVDKARSLSRPKGTACHGLWGWP